MSKLTLKQIALQYYPDGIYRNYNKCYNCDDNFSDVPIKTCR